MNKLLPKRVFMYSLYGLLIQLLLFSFLLASETTNGQKAQSIRNIKISVDFEYDNIRKAFSKIEKKTGFSFVYLKNDIDERIRLNATYEKVTLYELLISLSGETGLQFQRVNDNINVKRLSDQKQSVIAEVFDDLKITGKVTDENDNGLPGVAILVKGTLNGTISDAFGNYAITASDDGVLVFSYVGYETKEVNINGRSVIDFKMVPDVQSLAEIVVIGYGSKEKTALTSAITVVNQEFLESKPITSTTQALQGAQGLFVNQESGQPGRDNASITIRGQNSYATSSNPLVLVDGVEFPLEDINPEDIETISVLKDAAAASIYGSRAANGVILVVTKKGKKGAGLNLNYSNYFGFQEVTAVPDFNSDPVRHLELYNLARENSGVDAIYEESLIQEWRDNVGTNDFIYPSTDWADLFYQKGFIQNHTLNMNGGGEDSRFNATIGFLDQNGVYYKSSTNSERYTLNFSYESTFKDKLTLGVNFKGSLRNIEEPPQVFGSAGPLWTNWLLLRALPIHAPFTSDGQFGTTWLSVPNAQVFRNPVGLATAAKRTDRVQRYLTQLYAEYELPMDLTLKFSLSADNEDLFSAAYIPQVDNVDESGRRPANLNGINFIYDPSRNGPIARRRARNAFDVTLFTTLDYNKTFGDHSIDAIVGFSRETFEDENFNLSVDGFPVNGLSDLDVFTDINTQDFGNGFSGRTNQNRLLSFFGRVSYDYAQRYFFETTVRRDGSSKFGKDQRFGTFPAFSLGWRIDNESFFDFEPVNLLKLRASWGKLGNQNIGNNRFLATITLGENYLIGGVDRTGGAVIRAVDPDITWEEVTSSNLGIEAGFLNKLNLTFDYYIKETEGILGSVRLPSQVGNLQGAVTNFGTVENKGFELGISYGDETSGIDYNFSGTIAKVNNEITALEPGVEENINGNFINRVGSPINSYFLLESDGLLRTQDDLDNSVLINSIHGIGDLRYVDQNNDGVIDGDDRVLISDGVQPDFTYTFNLGVGYKGLSLDAFFQGVQGISVLYNHNLARPFHNGAGVTEEWIKKAHSADNPNGEFPRLFTTFGDSPNRRVSSFWLKDGSYLRLKNIQLSYTLPASIIKNMGFGSAKVFLNGANVFTITDLEGFDPERDLDGNLTGFNYPSVKTYTAGVKVSF